VALLTPVMEHRTSAVRGTRRSTCRLIRRSNRHPAAPVNRRIGMLLTLALILFVAWLLGLVGVYTIGSIVHVLLVIAIVLFLVGIISGRRTVV
jgi:hypothetical protein